MSTLEVKFKNKDGTSDWDYILNVRPNSDMSAATFWQKFFYRLLDDNEVLVIFTDDNQLLIADDFSRTEYAVYDDVFTNVMVKILSLNVHGTCLTSFIWNIITKN